MKHDKISQDISAKGHEELATTYAGPGLAVSLLKMMDWWQSAMDENIKALDIPKIGRTPSMLISYIILGEHRPTRLAQKLGISRQALHGYIRKMMDLNILELTKDPNDGRAQIVQLTKGQAGRADLYPLLLNALDAHLSEKLGHAQYNAFREIALSDWGQHPILTEEQLKKAAR